MGNTQSEMKINLSHMKGAKLPVTDVSWEDCHDFVKKLNKKQVANLGSPRKQNGNMLAGREQSQRIHLEIV